MTSCNAADRRHLGCMCEDFALTRGGRRGVINTQPSTNDSSRLRRPSAIFCLPRLTTVVLLHSSAPLALLSCDTRRGPAPPRGTAAAAAAVSPFFPRQPANQHASIAEMTRNAGYNPFMSIQSSPPWRPALEKKRSKF